MADFEELKNELIKSYQDLLELQYHEKPKAREHIKTICESLIADMVLWKIQEQCMDVDVSVGVQLDIIGKWVDIDRYFKGNKYENNKWYAYYDWDEKDQPNSLQGGMWDWDTSEKPNNAPFLNYDWILVIKNKLIDDDFRTLIKLKIIKNNTNATCKNIDDEIYKLFKGVIYTIWGEKLFDKSKFTIIGNPTITDNGIASGFTASNYIKTSIIIPANSEIKIAGRFTMSESTFGGRAIIFHYGDIISNRIWLQIEHGDKLQLAGGDGKKRATSTNKLDFGATYDYECIFNGSNLLTLKFKKIEDKDFTVVTANQTATIGNTNLTDLYFGIYSNKTLPFKMGSIDLKAFSITVDGKEVFSGVKDKVMELTYKYPNNKTSIMNLAKTKNCLPCPSGVHLKMEGILDNE